MRYSDEFKNNVVSRLLAGEVSISQAKEQYGVSCNTLRAWRKATLEEATVGSRPGASATGVNPSMKKLKLPQNVSYLQAHEAVTAQRLLSETEFGAYCRKHGLLSSSVSEWAKWFKTHPNACNAEDLQAERQLRLKAQSEATAKTKELARKDKALADTTTMLVLAKKAQAIWGVKES